MQIHIKRTKEPTKGFLAGKNWKLSFAISVSLSEAEKALVAKYYDPSIAALCVHVPGHIRFHYDGTDEMYKVVKVDQQNSDLGNFKLSASVSGHEYLGNIQDFETATIRALEDALNHLQNFDNWEGEKVAGS